MKPYTTRSGVQQFKPSIEELTELDADGAGFCLACGNTQEGVEPDAVKYECESCGAHKVYGAAELALLGLCY